MMRAFTLPVLACLAFALSPLNSLAQSLRFDMGLLARLAALWALGRRRPTAR